MSGYEKGSKQLNRNIFLIGLVKHRHRKFGMPLGDFRVMKKGSVESYWGFLGALVGVISRLLRSRSVDLPIIICSQSHRSEIW